MGRVPGNCSVFPMAGTAWTWLLPSSSFQVPCKKGSDCCKSTEICQDVGLNIHQPHFPNSEGDRS